MDKPPVEIPGYDIDREIGAGGMALVFLATQTNLGREVALKVLRDELASDGEDFKRRFLHEGQMLAKLVHPNIVAIHDIGETGKLSYMAMEYLKGGTLNSRIKEGLSVAEVIRITTQIAHALSLAHDNHIVHRDLKPSNIMFRDEITPVLTDFGIAKKTDSQHSLTKTGMVVGTPYYMSPEQITGRSIDGRSDIYSLGIMFYELLAGELPFRAEEPLALAMQHVQEPPPPLPESVKEMQPVMDRLLAKNADDRYQTMLDVCAEIKDLVLNDPAMRAKLDGDVKLFSSDQFSDPRLGTGTGARTSGPGTRPGTGQRTGARAPDSGATAIINTGTGQIVKKKNWKLPAAIAAAVVAASVGGYLYFGGTPSDNLTARDQRKVESLLLRAQNDYNSSKFVNADGDNAVAKLQEVFKISPNNSEARDMAESIAVVVSGIIYEDIDEGNTDEATRKLNLVLSVDPENEELSELKAEIDAKIAAEQRREQIEQLIAQARQFEQSDRLIAPAGENAYEAFQEVIRLDNANAEAAAGLNRIQTALVTEARRALGSDNLERAGQIAANAEKLFPDAATVTELSRDIDSEQRRRREAAEVAELLIAATEQLEAERFVFPPGDNALESYQSVLGFQPENDAALAGLNRIGDYFYAQAQAAFDAGDFGGSVDFSSRGLRARPDDSQLLAIQSQATGRLDANAREVENRLQLAERLTLDGQYLSGPQGGARAAYERVLEISPGNARATAALTRLPDSILATANQLQRDGNYSAADGLLVEAISAYPDDQRFAELQGAVGEQLAEQMRAFRLQQMLADGQRLVAVRPMTRTNFVQAATALKEIISEYPAETQARSLMGQLTVALAEEANQIGNQGDYDAAFRLIDAGLEEFSGNEALIASRKAISDERERRLAEEAARIAAMSGTLAIDASPWGEVVQVVDSSGNPTELPPDPTTPLVLSLVEGSYQVIVKGSGANSSKRLDVTVERQKTVAARAEFDAMTADAYFETSGW